LNEIVTNLQERLTRGDCIYLHCWGGRGRVGTVAACLLAAMYGCVARVAVQGWWEL